jgi:aspartate/methionine/tyrosine aminotransferase
MTGWRMGYGVMPKKLAGHMTKLMVNSNSCTAAFTQIAGIQALQQDPKPVHDMVNIFQKRRDRIVDLLNSVDGVSCRLPKGAFYVFPNTRALSEDSPKLADFLLQEGGIALLSGTSFGTMGQGYLRLSYATSLEMLEKGVRRMKAALANWPATG